MDPSSSISSEFAVGEQAMQETITYLKGELYKFAFDGRVEAINVDQGRPFHCLVTPNQNTVLHVYLSQSETGLSPILYGYSRFINWRSTNFVEQILNRCPSLLLKPNAKGEIPLHIAARFGHANIVELLIKHAKAEDGDLENGIEPAKQMLRMMDNKENTALHKAVRYGHIGVVRALIQEDTDFAYSGNKSGETPLYIAARRRDVGLVTMILDKCKSVNHDGPCGRTALHAAVMARAEGNTKVILCRRKNLTKSADENGQTPLHYAAHFGYGQIVKQLLECDESAAYITDKNEKMTALLMAARQGHHEIMREIIKHCPGCCEIVDKRGWNFCHFAAVSLNQFRVIKLVGDEFCRRFVDEEDFHGNTPLQVVAVSRQGLRSVRKDAKFDIVTVGEENLDSRKKEQIFELLEEVGTGEVAGVTVQPLRHYKMDGSAFDKQREARSLVAGLIATVTFAAVFTVPGGYKSDQSLKGQGTAILSHDTTFKIFVIADAIAMVSSLLAINLNYLSVLPIKVARGRQAGYYSFTLMMDFNLLAEAALVAAFATGIYAVLKPSLALAISTCVIALSFYLLFVWLLCEVQNRELI